MALSLGLVFPGSGWAQDQQAPSEREQAAEDRERTRILQLPAEVKESVRRFTPYFDIGVTQGLYIPTQGVFFSGTNMGSNVGLLTNLSEDHSIFGLYRFDYSGPGFQVQDGKEFQSRSLGHGFSGEYRLKFSPAVMGSPTLRLRPGASYGINFARTVANEIWGEGLYDYNSLGGQLALDWLPEWGIVTGQVLFRKLEFPNYTDLLREFQNAGVQSELSGGLQDQNVLEFGANARWRKAFGGVRYNIQDFANEKVVEPSGTTGAYGGTPQKDTSLILSAGLQASVWRFETAPQLSYNIHRSNQNFLRFKFFGDTAPAFIADNYNYNDLVFNAPLFFNFTRKYAVNASISQTFRAYSARPPRDGQNEYLTGEKQRNYLTTLGGGFRVRLNEVSFLHLNYGLVVASSNNKFEQYLPYNYTGNVVSFGYALAY